MVWSKNNSEKEIAVWVITPNGTKHAEKLLSELPGVDLHMSEQLTDLKQFHHPFRTLSEAVRDNFKKYKGHIFIMSTGIVVRIIAPFIRSKTTDPAVVVVDDRGQHAISLLSGHLGGANELAQRVADTLGAKPVITTATDVNNKPAVDRLATEKRLFIENPRAIKNVNMALLTEQSIYVHDPFNRIGSGIPNLISWPKTTVAKKQKPVTGRQADRCIPGIFVDDVIVDLPAKILILRPATLTAGIGCNRNTEKHEIKELLEKTLQKFKLASGSLKQLASIDIKADEPGLIAVSRELGLNLVFFSRDELNRVKNIQTPSAMVEKHIGVKSVCEAAALLAAKGGPLVVPKQSTRNVTLAIARMASMSSESDPVAWIT